MFQGGARPTAKDWVFHDPERNFKRGALVSSTYRRRASDSRGELVIFLTPRIVNRSEALGH